MGVGVLLFKTRDLELAERTMMRLNREDRAPQMEWYVERIEDEHFPWGIFERLKGPLPECMKPIDGVEPSALIVGGDGPSLLTDHDSKPAQPASETTRERESGNDGD